MKPFSRNEEHLAARLRGDADGAREDPSPELHGRILAAIRSARPLARPHEPAPLSDPRHVLAIAAALLVLVSAWSLLPTTAGVDGGSVTSPVEEPDVASLRELLELRPDTLLASAEDPLWTEAQNLLSDANRAAEGLVRGLPARLRGPFEREQERR